MYVKKRMSLLLFAALAMVLFTACGRWDFSREAAKAANEAQGANPVVTFDTSRALTDALRDAAGENVQPDDIEAALKADGTLTELLAGRSDLDIYFAAGDQSADDAAAAIAAQLGRLTGRKPEAFIAMVKADNGYFYAAIVSYRTGSSSSASDGNGGTSGGNQGDDQTKEEYTVYWSDPSNGTIDVKTNDSDIDSGDEVEKGTVLTITAVPSTGYELESVTVTEAGAETKLDAGNYSWTVNGNVTIKVTFKKCTITGLTVEGTFKNEYWVCYNEEHGGGEKLDLSGLKVRATYSNGTWEDVTSECTFDPDTNYEFTKADARNGQKTITIKHPDFNSIQTVTVTVHDVYTQISPTDKTGKDITFNDGDTFTPKGMMINIWYYVDGSPSVRNPIEITQEMIENGEVTFDAIKLKGGIIPHKPRKVNVSVTYRGQKNIFDVYVY